MEEPTTAAGVEIMALEVDRGSVALLKTHTDSGPCGPASLLVGVSYNTHCE